MKVKPDLSFWKLWNISFGFFGVQIAYALQSANISRIFATLGADPHSLSYFWILPPLAGIIVQPIIGSASDKTWTRFGRRIPYLFVGSLIAVLVMCLLPNAGSFGMAVGTAMTFGLVSLMFLDTSINMAMQPFKMLVGDMVNEKQKGLAYSIQSFLCNAGSLVGYLFPFIFTFIGISNTAGKGTVPDSVIYSFYIGAAILILCVIYTTVKVKEMPPKEFEEFPRYHSRRKERENRLHLSAEACPESILDGRPGTVLLLGGLHVHVDVYQRCHRSHRMGHHRRAERRLSGSGQLGRCPVCRTGHRLGHLGSGAPLFKARKQAYALSLVLGGAGFISTLFFHNEYLLFISYLLIGCAWAAMLALPFTILTNSVSGKNMGAYLGLFNGTICVPQIVAALVGGGILHLVGGHQVNMLVLAGVLLIVGAVCVYFIKETVVHHEG